MSGSIMGSVAASSGASVHYTWYLNSVFQPFNTAAALPNIVGGGSASTEPAGFSDLFSTNGPYLNFRVVGMAASAQVLTTVSGDNLIMTMAPGDTFGGVHSNATKASQGLGSVTKIIGFGNGASPIVSGSWATAAVAGVSENEVIDSSQWQGTYNALPGNTILMQLWLTQADAATNSNAISYRVQAAWDVICETPAWTANLDDVDELSLKKRKSASHEDSKSSTRASVVEDYTVLASSSSSSSSSSSASRKGCDAGGKSKSSEK